MCELHCILSVSDIAALHSAWGEARKPTVVAQSWLVLRERFISGERYEKIGMAQRRVRVLARGVCVHQRDGRLVDGALSTGAIKRWHRLEAGERAGSVCPTCCVLSTE